MGCKYSVNTNEDEIQSHNNDPIPSKHLSELKASNNNTNKTNVVIPPGQDNQGIVYEFPYNNDNANNIDDFKASNNNGQINEQIYQENLSNQMEDNFLNNDDNANANDNNITVSEPKDSYSKSVLDQINELRREPSLFIPKIEEGINYITKEFSKKDGLEKLIYKNRVKVALNEGEIAFRNAMTDLQNREGMPPLQFKEEICIPLPSTVEELNDRGYLKREWSKLCETQDVSTCWRELVKDPDVSFLLMVVDDSGKKSLMKRNDILNPEYKYIGITSTMIGKHFIAFFSFAK